MATHVAVSKHDRGGETERRMNGLRRAGKTAGLSRVRRAAPSRSHESHSVGGSGETRSEGAYSQPFTLSSNAKTRKRPLRCLRLNPRGRLFTPASAADFRFDALSPRLGPAEIFSAFLCLFSDNPNFTLFPLRRSAMNRTKPVPMGVRNQPLSPMSLPQVS